MKIIYGNNFQQYNYNEIIYSLLKNSKTTVISINEELSSRRKINHLTKFLNLIKSRLLMIKYFSVTNFKKI